MNVLIVDDEKTTRQGLLNHIEWKKFDITQIREAQDGTDALELCKTYVPDIMISDIRMPIMNGIELCTKIRQLYPECKIIFLSGYSDKEYLKSAIHLGVIHYVEKPIDLLEMEEAIEKAVRLHQLDRERNQGQVPVEVVKQQLIATLIHKSNEVNAIREKLKQLNLLFKDGRDMNVVVIKVAADAGSLKDMKQALTNSLEDYFQEQGILADVKDSRHTVMILCASEGGLNGSLQSWINRLAEDNAQLFGQLFISVGMEVTQIDKIYESYQSAVISLQSHFIKGYGSSIFYGEEMTGQSIGADAIVGEFKEILVEMDMERIRQFSSQLFMKIRFSKSAFANDIKNTCFQLCLELYREAERQVSYQRDETEKDEPYLWEEIFQIETLNALKSFFDMEIEKIANAVDSNQGFSKAVLRVRKIIEGHYMEADLSTKSLAEQVFLTTTYLSGLFSKETGMTISEYITRVRIEQSMVLIKDNQMKLAEIAQKIGYSDANYYTKAFKKVTGRTPSDYRERQL